MKSTAPPIVLSIAGHDPSGGAGIQADIEAITAQGCRAASVITCLTVQDSSDVARLVPLDPALVREQALTVLADLPVGVIKVGLLGDAQVAEVVAAVCRQYPAVPLVLDPVLASGGGTVLADDTLLEVIRQQLLPHTTLLTPNLTEARRLSGQINVDDCARQLLACGVPDLLLTGADTDEDEQQVINRFYRADGSLTQAQWPRLPHSYHGSGCTLAAACAARLALGEEPTQAVDTAQRYTWHSLQLAARPGHGQYLPTRWPSCN